MVALTEEDKQDVQVEVDDYTRGQSAQRCDQCGDVGATKHMKACENAKDG